MIELGKKQTLTVVKTVDFGVYLAERMIRKAKIPYCFLPNRYLQARKLEMS